MSASGGCALALGATMGFGLWLIVGAIPRWSRPRLFERIAPYLRDVSPEAYDSAMRASAEPSGLIVAVLGPPLRRATRFMAERAGGDAALAERLRAAGDPRGTDEARARQLLVAAGGCLAGSVLAASLVARGAPALLAWLVPIVAALVAFAGCDASLRRRIRRRAARIDAETPTVLEFLSLSLAAGEGVRDALGRVATTGRGELCREIGVAVERVRTGVSLAAALGEMSRDLAVPSVSRFVDQLLGALERGAPVAEVLRAQAKDARAAGKRRLLEEAGRREIAMMFPLVFLILPLSVAIAIFPGIDVIAGAFFS